MTSSSVIDLNTALKHAKQVYANNLSKAGSKRPLFLTRDFTIGYKSKDAGNAVELFGNVIELFNASKDIRKLSQTKELFKVINLITPFPDELRNQIDEVHAVMAKARLDNLPGLLSMLVYVKQVMQLHFNYIESLFRIVPAARFAKAELTEFIPGVGKALRCKLKDPVAQNELENLVASTSGLAFLTRFPKVFIPGAAELDLNQLSPEDAHALKEFTQAETSTTSKLANLLYRFWEGSVAMTQSKEAENTLLTFVDKSTIKAYFGFLGAAFPVFVEYMELCQKRSGGDHAWGEDTTNPKFISFLSRMYRKAQELHSQASELDASYKTLLDEYLELQKKANPSRDKEPQRPPFFLPTLHGPDGRDGAQPIPSPDEYAKLPLNLASLDLEHYLYPPATKQEKAKPVSIQTPAFDKGDSKENLGIQEKVERKKDESKESKKNNIESPIPFAPSPFDGRTFPFETIQYADRVMEWETDPKKALERPEYRNLTKKAQAEVTWKHATNVVDCFLGTAYSRQVKWKDRDLAYLVQAEVEWNGQLYRGFFRYAFNEKGELYHRDFGIRSNFEFVDAICNNKLFVAEDFPSLQQSQEDYLAKGKPVSVVKLGSVPYKMNNLGIVEVEDPQYGLKIRLFKHGKI